MRKYDMLCTGTALVDSIIRGLEPNPISPSHFLAESGTLSVGGEAVNEAIAGSKLGLKTAIQCRLGKDAAGELILQTLCQNGVETETVLRSEAATPVSTLLVGEDGSRQSVMNRAHRVGFNPDTSVFCETRVVILGSLFRAPFDDPERIFHTVQAAKQAGALVLADTKLPNASPLTLEDLRDSLPLLDYIFPNQDEAAFFSGEAEPEAMAEAFLCYGVKNVVVKLGNRGCLLKNRAETLSEAGLRVRAVDATGAGDNFLAGFVSELLRGSGHAKALRFANACGAACTTVVGAAGGLQSRDQVLSLLQENR